MAKDTTDINQAARSLVARCPACGRDLVQHDWAVLGTAQTDTPHERALRVAFEEGDWSTIMNLHGGSGLTDFFEVAALRCPVTGRVSTLEIPSYFDLWMDDEVVQTRVLSLDDSSAVAVRIDAETWTTIR